MANPFINRLPIYNPDFFFGRQNQVREIISLIGATIPQSGYIVGERRIGKTSLLNYISHPNGALKKYSTYLARSQSEYLFVYIDLEALEIDPSKMQNVQMFFFRYLLRRIHDEVQRQYDKDNHTKSSELQRIFDSCNSNTSINELVTFGFRDYLQVLYDTTGYTTVLMLDEADKIIRLNIGHKLRPLISNQEVPLSCLMSTQKLLQDLDPEKELSPLYNLLTVVPLGLMEEYEVREMIMDQLKNSGKAFSEIVIDWIIDLGGHHPDFTNRVAYHVFNADYWSEPIDTLEKLYPEIYLDLEPVCRNLWDSLTGHDKLQPGLNSINSQVLSSLANQQPVSSDLKFSTKQMLERGYLRLDDSGEVRIFSRIFKDYVLYRMDLGRRDLQPTIDSPNYLPVIDSPSLPKVVFEDERFYYADIPIPLSKRESLILKFLFSNVGKVCGRQDIFEYAWKTPYDTQKEATVNIAVQRLRKKISKYLQDRVVIQSERNLGYRLIST